MAGKVSKYKALWDYVQSRTEITFQMTFDEIGIAAGVPLDHSFLNAKKELEAFGWRVGKISLKEKTVIFEKTTPEKE